jgi:HK97 gp10 family phage protein
MVSVPSSMNRSQTSTVNVEIKGVAEAMRKIMEKGKMIKDGTDAKLFQAANMLQQEIQESIIGNRAEVKSVDTGNFANSITVQKLADLKYSVETDVEYSKFLEYGTSKMPARYHFRNSVSRNTDKINSIVNS